MNAVTTEVKAVAEKPKVLSTDEKLEAGYRWVTVPKKDIYGYPFKGMYLNEKYFESGTHLVEADVATALEERLERFNEYSIHLMRPDADIKTLKELSSEKR